MPAPGHALRVRDHRQPLPLASSPPAFAVDALPHRACRPSRGSSSARLLLAREFEYGTFRLGLDAEPLAAALGAFEDGAAGTRDNRGGGARGPLTMWWRRPFDDISGASAPAASISRAWSFPPTRSSLSRSGSCAACSCAARSLRCLSRWSFSSPSASASRSSRRPNYLPPRHRTVESVDAERRRARLDPREPPGRRRRAAHLYLSGGPRDHARPARAGWTLSHHLAVARLAPRHHLPAERPLLDIPGDRGRPVLRPGRAGRAGNHHRSCAGRRRDRSVRPLRAPAPRGQPCACARGPRGCGNRDAAAAGGFLRGHPRWRFVFVNHATTNPFFVPARYGIADAASLLRSRLRVDRVEAQRRRGDGDGDAARDRAAGRRHRRLDHRPARLQRPSRTTALGLGIPVVSSTPWRQPQPAARLCRPGPLPIRPGSSARGSPRSCPEGDVLLFIATPGQLNIQPRVDGALDAIRDSGRPILRARGRDGRGRLQPSGARSRRPTAPTRTCAACSPSTAARRRRSPT